jgi:nicotinamide mononucleotide transporter
MSLEEIYHQFITDIHYIRWQEWASTFAQIVSVWYARKNNILVYPTGIVGVLLAAWVYFAIAAPPLYADGVLNIYYFFMSIYGWYNWTKLKDNQHIQYPISWCQPRELLTGIIAFLGGWFIIYYMLVEITDSNTPFLDSLVSASAVTAMWWMSQRKIENWLAWIFSNIVAIPLNFYKGFMLFTAMYLLFLIMAYFGYREWKNTIKNTTQ